MLWPSLTRVQYYHCFQLDPLGAIVKMSFIWEVIFTLPRLRAWLNMEPESARNRSKLSVEFELTKLDQF